MADGYKYFDAKGSPFVPPEEAAATPAAPGAAPGYTYRDAAGKELAPPPDAEPYKPDAEKPAGIFRRAFGDTAVGLAQGVIATGQTLYGLADPATGGALDRASKAVSRGASTIANAFGDAVTGRTIGADYGPTDDRLSESFGQATQSLEPLKSPQLRAATEKVNAVNKDMPKTEVTDFGSLMTRAGEELRAGGRTIGAMLENPSTIADQVAQSAPVMMGMMGAVRKVAVGAGERAFAATLEAGGDRVAAQAAREAAITRWSVGGPGIGVQAAVDFTTSGAQQSQQAKTDVLGMDEKTLLNSPQYRDLRAAGVSFEEARDQLADLAMLKAFAVAGTLSAAATPIGANVEGRAATAGLAREATHKFLGLPMPKGAVGKAALAVGQEFTQEALQTAGEQIGTNYGAQVADPRIGLLDKVGEQAAMGGLAGGVMGGGMHVVGELGTPRAAPGAAPGLDATQGAPAPGEPPAGPVPAAGTAVPPLTEAGSFPRLPADASPPTPSEAMGLDPNAGPLSGAAAMAADGGLVATINAQRADEALAGMAQQAAKDTDGQRDFKRPATDADEMSDSAINNQLAVAAAAEGQGGGQLFPFKNEKAARERATLWTERTGNEHVAVPHPMRSGMWSVVPRGSDLATKVYGPVADATDPAAETKPVAAETKGAPAATKPPVDATIATNPAPPAGAKSKAGAAPTYDFVKTFPKPNDANMRAAGRQGTLDQKERPGQTNQQFLREQHNEWRNELHGHLQAVNEADDILSGKAELKRPLTAKQRDQVETERAENNALIDGMLSDYEDRFGSSARAQFEAHARNSLSTGAAAPNPPSPAAKAAPAPAPAGQQDRPATTPTHPTDVAAHAAATSPLNTKAEPTRDQALAGNYAKGHLQVGPLDISVENPEGSTRSDKQHTPPQWSSQIKRAHYGYIRGTIGADKDHIDVFVKPGTNPDHAGPVFVIDQYTAGGKFDEHKVMVGYDSQLDAVGAYKANYPKGHKVGPVAKTTMGELNTWARGERTKKPFGLRTSPLLWGAPEAPKTDEKTLAPSTMAKRATELAKELARFDETRSIAQGLRNVVAGKHVGDFKLTKDSDLNPWREQLAKAKANAETAAAPAAKDGTEVADFRPGDTVAIYFPADKTSDGAYEKVGTITAAADGQYTVKPNGSKALTVARDRITLLGQNRALPPELEAADRAAREARRDAARDAPSEEPFDITAELARIRETGEADELDTDQVSPVNGKAPPKRVNDPKERLLLIQCADTKADTGGKAVPAWQLYNGPFWTTLRSILKDVPQAKWPRIKVLSGKHGLIEGDTEIAPYDQRLTPEKAREVTDEQGIQWRSELRARDIFIIGGADYRPTFHTLVRQLEEDGDTTPSVAINEARGAGNGEMRSQLGDWLRNAVGIPPESEAKEVPQEAAAGEGASPEETAEIAEVFDDAVEGAKADAGPMHHLFDPPAKGEVVRLADKVKVYHAKHGWMTVDEAKTKIREWEDNAVQQGKNLLKNGNGDKVVISLFDLTGEWSLPWEQAGYDVYRFDIQKAPDPATESWADPESPDYDENLANEHDVNHHSVDLFSDVYGMFDGKDIYAVLAAVPCTDFAVSGARHFAAKDADGRTVASIQLVKQTQATVEFFKPSVWAIENPVGRIESLGGLPPWRLSFDPNHLGDPYTKKTLLWGRFNADLPIAPVEPTEGSKMWSQYGGKSQATKNARSATPEGFAYAFFQANNAVDNPLLAIANKFDRLDRGLMEKAVAAGLTYAEITAAVQNDYYFHLDDEAAEQKLRAAIVERETVAPPEAAPAPAAPEAPPQPAASKVELADIPPAFLTKHKLAVEVWIEDEAKFETVDLPARQVLAEADTRLNAYKSLLACLQGAA